MNKNCKWQCSPEIDEGEKSRGLTLAAWLQPEAVSSKQERSRGPAQESGSSAQSDPSCTFSHASERKLDLTLVLGLDVGGVHLFSLVFWI